MSISVLTRKVSSKNAYATAMKTHSFNRPAASAGSSSKPSFLSALLKAFSTPNA